MRLTSYLRLPALFSLLFIISSFGYANEEQKFENRFFVITPPKGQEWVATTSNDYKVVLNSATENESIYTLYVAGFKSKSRGTGQEFQKESEENFYKNLPFEKDGFKITEKNIVGLKKEKYTCVTGDLKGYSSQNLKLRSKIAVCRHPDYEDGGFLIGYSVVDHGNSSVNLPDFKALINSIDTK